MRRMIWLLFITVAFCAVTITPSTTIQKEVTFNGSASPNWVGQATGGGSVSTGSMPQSRHVLVLFEENQPFSAAFPNGMPFLDGLVTNIYAYGTNYFATAGGSLLDYLAFASGSSETQFGCNGGGCSSPITDDNIFRELNKAGMTWKVYMDGLPSVGFMGLTFSSSAGTYYKRHNPAPWYSDIISSAAMQQLIVPWSQFAVDVNNNALPNFVFIAPSGLHDAHDSSVANADSWFQANLGVLLNSAYFKPGGDGVLFVTYDENGGGTNNPAIPVFFAALGPLIKHGVVSNTYNHYDLGRTVFDLLGLKTYPNNIATGHDMIQFFSATTSVGGTSALGPYPDTRAGVLTKDYEIASVNNISGVNIHQLMYPGFNGKIMVAYMVWFFDKSGCSSSNGGIGGWSLSRRVCYGSHIDNGISSNDPNYVNNDMNELFRRGIDGPLITWEGVYINGTRTPKHEDEATQLIAANLQNRCVLANNVCPMFFALQEDSTALIFSTGFAAAAGTVSSNGIFQPHNVSTISIATNADEQNILAHLKDDICYANKFYFSNPAYLRTNGQPVWQAFVSENGILTGGAPSWQDMWSQFGTFAANLGTNCPAFSSVYSGAPSNNAFIMLNGTSTTHDNIAVGPGNAIDGVYLWDNLGGTGGVGGQTSNVTTALSSQATYNSNMRNIPLVAHMGGAWPGFDDQLAGWSPNGGGCGAGSYCTTSGRVQDRACGMTWINSFAGQSNGYSLTRQLPFVQVVTWNDWDEGSEMQSGIDNCFTLSASLNGSIVQWQLNATSGAANLATIDHMTVYASADNVNMGIVADNLTPAMSGSFDLTKGNINPGQYTFYVKAWGKNSIVNHFASTNGNVNITFTGTGACAAVTQQPVPVPVVSTNPSIGPYEFNNSVATWPAPYILPNNGRPQLFVATTGNDSTGNGTQGNPYATIGKADSVATPGTIVHVASGTYNGKITTSKSGTAGNNISFVSDTQYGAHIVFNGGTNADEDWHSNGNHVDIMGFDVTGNTASVGIGVNGSFTRTIGNKVHDVPPACNSNGGAGIDAENYFATDDDEIANIVWNVNNAACPPSTPHGICIYHANLRGHVLNNIALNCKQSSIQLWHAGNNVVISGNIAADSDVGILVGAGDAPGGVVDDNTLVTNNLVFNNAIFGIEEEGATGTHNVYMNNLTFNNPTAYQLKNNLHPLAVVTGNPLLVNYNKNGTGDYHLTSGSPAISAGTMTGIFTADFSGGPRPAGSNVTQTVVTPSGCVSNVTNVRPGNPPGPPFVSPFPSYVAGASAFIKSKQLSDGAIPGATIIIPHDANLAAIGWTQDTSQLPNVVNYMKWYVSHLNTSTDVWGNTLYTIYDYNISAGATGTCVGSPTCTAQATDNYAATFLSLAYALYQTGDAPSQAYVKSISNTLNNIGTNVLLNQQQTDGLIWYLPSTFGQIKKLVNNAEDYRGLLDMALLEKNAFGNNTLAVTYASAAQMLQSGFIGLYNSTTQTWPTQEDSTGNKTAANLRSWTDMMSQLYPMMNNVVSLSDVKTQRSYAQLNTFWPTWPNLNFQFDSSDTGQLPWVSVAYAGSLVGDQSRVSGYLNAINTIYILSQFPSPFTTLDAGYTIRASNGVLQAVLSNFNPAPLVFTSGTGSTGTVQLPGRKKQPSIVIIGDN